MKEQFNLENFLAGKYERVETRDGKKVDDLAYFPKAAPYYKLAGTIDDGVNGLDTWYENGLYSRNNESNLDLFGILKPQQ